MERKDKKQFGHWKIPLSREDDWDRRAPRNSVNAQALGRNLHYHGTVPRQILRLKDIFPRKMQNQMVRAILEKD
ncbi:hypothetical protein FQA39_LY19344 [Lamprigera yunnana]|nr:hypothetical protein FQA39_LY19344 [Lamprigera yunnana]